MTTSSSHARCPSSIPKTPGGIEGGGGSDTRKFVENTNIKARQTTRLWAYRGTTAHGLSLCFTQTKSEQHSNEFSVVAVR